MSAAVSRYSRVLAEIVRLVIAPMTLSTRKLSGVTSPLTTASPKPQDASMAICDRSPFSGLRVNATPAARGLTICCTPTLIAAPCCRYPRSSR